LGAHISRNVRPHSCVSTAGRLLNLFAALKNLARAESSRRDRVGYYCLG
jgi:hypothetical protein